MAYSEGNKTRNPNPKGSKANTQNDYRSINARNVNKAKRPDGYIYLLQFGNENLFKVGVSHNPDRRIRDIDSSSPIPIKTIGKFFFKNVYEMEECIHDNLSEYYLRHEWFKVDYEIIKNISLQLSEMSSQGQHLIPVQLKIAI